MATNDYYNHTSRAPTRGKATSAYVNARGDEVAAGFSKLPSEAHLKRGALNVATTSGTAAAYTATLSYVTNYVDHLSISMRIHAANTGAATLNVNGLGAKQIKRPDGTALQPGDLALNGLFELVYDAAAGYFVIRNAMPVLVANAAASASAAAESAAAAAESEEAAAESAAAAAASAGSIAVQSSPTDTTAGRLMAVGAFGVGRSLAYSGDLAELLAPGEYWALADSTGKPAGVMAGFLKVSAHFTNTNHYQQRLLDYATGKEYIRISSSTENVISWSAWTQNGGGSGGNNLLINGEFERWIRGNEFTSISGRVITADRWITTRTSNAGLYKVDRIDGKRGRYALKMERSFGDSATNSMVLTQVLETATVVPLRGKELTVSLYVYAGEGANMSGFAIGAHSNLLTDAEVTGLSSAGNISGGTNTTIKQELTPLSTTLTRVSMTFTVPADANVLNIRLIYTPLADYSGEDWVAFEQAKLEIGSAATEFESRPIAEEIALCERYSRLVGTGLAGGVFDTSSVIVGVPHSGMRVAPSGTLFSSDLQIISGGSTFTASPPTLTSISASANGSRLRISGFTGLTAGRGLVVDTPNCILLNAEIGA